MFINGKTSIKRIGVSLAILIGLFITLALAANAFQTETAESSDKAPAPAGKSENEIEVIAKILSIDPIKGDVTTRLEFFPHGTFAKEDGTLAKTLKLDINSSNGKQEITFDKGKRMPPTEAVLDMYDGAVTDYPFDKQSANLTFFFSLKPDKPADKPKTTETKTEPKDELAPKSPDAKPEGETKPAADDDEDIDIPFSLNFEPQLAGYRIEATKSKDSDENYVDMELTISRHPMVIFFSVFIMVLMWGVSLGVLLLVLSVVVRGRKVEIAMFSFIATLIFAFVAVRNAQPGIPPIGIFTDYLSFFLAELVLAICLLTVLFTWLIRPAAK